MVKKKITKRNVKKKVSKKTTKKKTSVKTKLRKRPQTLKEDHNQYFEVDALKTEFVGFRCDKYLKTLLQGQPNMSNFVFKACLKELERNEEIIYSFNDRGSLMWSPTKPIYLTAKKKTKKKLLKR